MEPTLDRAAGWFMIRGVNDLGWLQNLAVGLFCSLGGLLFLVPGVLVFRSSYLKLRSWRTVSGTVIGYRGLQQPRPSDPQEIIDSHLAAKSSGRPSKQAAYEPQVQFTAVEGNMVTFTSSIGSNRQPYRVGAVVQVLSRPAKPGKRGDQIVFHHVCDSGFFRSRRRRIVGHRFARLFFQGNRVSLKTVDKAGTQAQSWRHYEIFTDN